MAHRREALHGELRTARIVNDPDAVELLELIRDRWRSDPNGFTPEDHIAWRTELVLVTYPAARDTLRALHIERPHKRPTLTQFIDALHARANRLSPAQIATNLAGINHVRQQLTRNRTPQEQTTT
jgi:hypothetical protein